MPFRNNQNIFYIYAKEISTLVKLMSIIDLETKSNTVTKDVS